jgi:hypothetical protein
MSDEAMSEEEDAVAAEAAAAAAAGASNSPPPPQQKKHKVRQQQSTSDKVRRLHGKCKKTPASQFTLLHLAAPVSTVAEERLF